MSISACYKYNNNKTNFSDKEMSSDRPARVKRSKIEIKPHFLPVEERGLNFNEVNLGYINEQEVIDEAERCLSCKKPRCEMACPTGFSVPKMLLAIKEGDMQKAADVVNDYFCTPSSQNRICPAFCQDACVVGRRGDAINILNVKRYLSDNYVKPASFYERQPLTHKRIAVIGSGPGGLTAAHELARLGHDVTIFERSTLGGMLAVGIPEYRLKNSLLHAEIKDLEKLDIKFELGESFGKDYTHKDLFEQGYSAVVIAIGAHKPKFMNIPGSELKGSIHAIEYLRHVAQGKDVDIGKRAIVIGGGDVAIDAVRVSRRMGVESEIVYRRSLEEMPATKEEIHATIEEKIPINFLTNPVEIIGDGEKVTHVKLVKMELGEPDESGRRRPSPIEGSEYIMEVNTVIHAISQEPDVDDVRNDFELTRWNTFTTKDEDSFETSVAGVFAVGDTVSGPKTAVEAISHAKKAVIEIDNYLNSQVPVESDIATNM